MLFDELTIQAYNYPHYATVQALAFDTYCMQHPETYCRSAKSYAAHLMRLCCGVEHDGNPAMYAAIRHWLDGAMIIQKPTVLTSFGSIIIVDVRAACNSTEHQQRVRVWATHVWDAYATQHELAHNWLQLALNRTKRMA